MGELPRNNPDEEKLFNEYISLFDQGAQDPLTMFASNPRAFYVIQQVLRDHPRAFLPDVLDSLLDMTEKTHPFKHFGNVVEAATKKIPDTGTMLFLGCGRGEELIATREKYPHAHFFGVERTPSFMSAYTAYGSKTDLWHTDLTDFIPVTELHEYTKGVPDLTVIRHPNPRDIFWQHTIPQLAETAVKHGKQLLVTNYHETEVTRLFELCKFLNLPYTRTVHIDRPKITRNSSDEISKKFVEECRSDKIVTVFG